MAQKFGKWNNCNLSDKCYFNMIFHKNTAFYGVRTGVELLFHRVTLECRNLIYELKQQNNKKLIL
ncbi:hypothetical protein GO684_02640 [Wolbachia endosymbiont of Litomosoides brasiliensis]|uniref:hypothetical protein n=1 Tax=Wolbachia endosymbiont of Litomosoides brasiliensis TaxID=1812117 RepID=UPI00158C8B68|nr:hypothetical protein [Wolbachia endosymbiont of Litomosoides brasiliensis]NUY39567.1 hypothetical protein [Wolbachia endosymbiont of Litomosoides brasiliensis]